MEWTFWFIYGTIGIGQKYNGFLEKVLYREKNMTTDQKLDLILAAVHGVNANVQELKTDVQRLEIRMTSLEGKVERLETRMTSLEGKVEHLETRMTSLEGEVKGLGSRVEGLEGEAVQLKNGMGLLEQKTTRINVILENEMRVNIQRVAEGHLDLVRNLQEAMKHSNEVEMLAARVNLLESDVKGLKQKVS